MKSLRWLGGKMPAEPPSIPGQSGQTQSGRQESTRLGHGDGWPGQSKRGERALESPWWQPLNDFGARGLCPGHPPDTHQQVSQSSTLGEDCSLKGGSSPVGRISCQSSSPISRPQTGPSTAGGTGDGWFSGATGGIPPVLRFAGMKTRVEYGQWHPEMLISATRRPSYRSSCRKPSLSVQRGR